MRLRVLSPYFIPPQLDTEDPLGKRVVRVTVPRLDAKITYGSNQKDIFETLPCSCQSTVYLTLTFMPW